MLTSPVTATPRRRCATSSRRAPAPGQAGQMQADPGIAGELHWGRDGDGLGTDGNSAGRGRLTSPAWAMPSRASQ